jgi:two-component system nitrogen regulation sensor histidine kinase NtrY
MTVMGTPEPNQHWLQRTLSRVARANWLSYALLTAALVAVIATYLILTGATPIAPTASVTLYLTIVDALLLGALVALVIGRLVQMWVMRRSGSDDAGLHRRLVTVFSLMTVVPVVVTAGAAAITINFAMEGWFSSGVRSVLDHSSAVTSAYVEGHNDSLRSELQFAAANLNTLTTLDFTTGRFGSYVEALAGRLKADVRVFTASGVEKPSGGAGASPSTEDFDRARRGETFVHANDDNGQIRGVTKLDVLDESGQELFLVVARDVNPKILALLRQQQEVADRYNRLAAERDDVMTTLSVVYGIVAFAMLLAAIWIGLSTANRIRAGTWPSR